MDKGLRQSADGVDIYVGPKAAQGHGALSPVTSYANAVEAARIAKNGFATSSSVSKSAKVVLARMEADGEIERTGSTIRIGYAM